MLSIALKWPFAKSFATVSSAGVEISMLSLVVLIAVMSIGSYFESLWAYQVGNLRITCRSSQNRAFWRLEEEEQAPGAITQGLYWLQF